MRRNAVAITVFALAAMPVTATRAVGQGFGVYEHDACTMGRAGTGVAMPCNASAIFFNPAGILVSGGKRNNLAAGATMINADFAFQDSVSGLTTNSTGGGVLVPNVHITRQLNDRWAIGIGLFAPYGLVSEWPSASTFPGRFLGYRSELKSIYIQPTAAWKVNSWLQIGGGVDYIRTTVDLKQRVDLSGQSPSAGVTFAQLGIPAGTDFADAHLSGGSWSATGHFGVIIRPISRLTIGARYLLRAKADIQGDATFSQIGTGIILGPGNPICNPPGSPPTCPANTPLDTVLAAQFRTGGSLVKQHASTTVPLPEQFVIGAAFKVTNQVTVLADFQRVQWSRFAQLPLTFANLGTRRLYEDYRNTNGYRVGVEVAPTAKITVRGGLLFHEGAAPPQTVTPLLPEAERAEQTLGLGFQLRPDCRIDLAYQHINQADRRGRVLDAPRGSTAFNTGLYTGSASLFGASLVWGF